VREGGVTEPAQQQLALLTPTRTELLVDVDHHELGEGGRRQGGREVDALGQLRPGHLELPPGRRQDRLERDRVGQHHAVDLHPRPQGEEVERDPGGRRQVRVDVDVREVTGREGSVEAGGVLLVDRDPLRRVAGELSDPAGEGAVAAFLVGQRVLGADEGVVDVRGDQLEAAVLDGEEPVVADEPTGPAELAGGLHPEEVGAGAVRAEERREGREQVLAVPDRADRLVGQAEGVAAPVEELLRRPSGLDVPELVAGLGEALDRQAVEQLLRLTSGARSSWPSETRTSSPEPSS
jgi:hypothetical protein